MKRIVFIGVFGRPRGIRPTRPLPCRMFALASRADLDLGQAPPNDAGDADRLRATALGDALQRSGPAVNSTSAPSLAS